MRHFFTLSTLVFISLFSTNPLKAEDKTLCFMGWASTEKGQYTQAINLFDECIEKGELSKSTLALTYRNRGITYRRMNKPEEAVADFERALEMNFNVEDLINLANAKSSVGDYASALRDYDQALEIKPKYNQIYYNRAVMFEQQKKWMAAKSDYELAFQLGVRGVAIEHKLAELGALELSPIKAEVPHYPVPENFFAVENGKIEDVSIVRHVPKGQKKDQWNLRITSTSREISQVPGIALREILNYRIDQFSSECKYFQRMNVVLPITPPMNYQPSTNSFGKSDLKTISGTTALFCDERDIGKVDKSISKNGFTMLKVIVSADKAYTYEFEWQHDKDKSEWIHNSGMLRNSLIPLFKKVWIEDIGK
ncbi:tetratricopeptide repeat protein [Kiloniella sp.]|uniref:tetratricopeptide repeat protein n=1 Tax=Kiloniella sp. TaxID=1938587 RepID=UPI003A8F8D45